MAGKEGKRPVPRLLALGELQERNRRAAEKEGRVMRADCIEYLQRMAAQGELSALLGEALPRYAPVLSVGATLAHRAEHSA